MKLRFNSMRGRQVFGTVSLAVFMSVAISSVEPVAQAGAIPCPGPATEAALIGVARAGASDERVIEWMMTCGLAFPVGIDAMERLLKAGVSEHVTGASVSGRYIYLLSNPSDQAIARIMLDTQPGAVARPFTAADKAKAIATIDAPIVTAIRTLLTRYAAKQLATDPEDRRGVRLLDALPPEALATPFMVLAVNPYVGGGDVITILFVHASHLVLDVHVKDGLVTFVRQKSLSNEVRERLAHYYRDTLQDAALLR